jgi:hypothetical protein
MSANHVMVYSQDESLASIVTEFLMFDGVSASFHTSQFDLFETIRVTQPAVVILVQPGGNRPWFQRLVETIYWDPGIGARMVVATHEPDRFRLRLGDQFDYVAAILTIPFDFTELCQSMRALIDFPQPVEQLADRNPPAPRPLPLAYPHQPATSAPRVLAHPHD